MADRYEVGKSIGEGGMAKVFEAFDHDLERRVAIKQLFEGPANDERRVVHFASEAKKMAAINHPNVVHIYSIEDDGERPPRIVMELAKGTLEQYLGGRPCEPILGERIARQVLQGLVAIHRANITHRDIKPANILHFEDGLFKVSDFGIATDGEQHTQSFATPRYMAPEVLSRPHLIGEGSDLYSLGLVLYEALIGADAFDQIVRELVGGAASGANRDTHGPIDAHVWGTFQGSRDELPRLHERDSNIPEALSDWVAKMTRKDIEKRFESSREALKALEHGTVASGYGAKITQPVDPTQQKKGLTRTQIALIAAVIVMLLGSVAVFMMLRGKSYLPVQITSDPSGASIFFDGAEVGRTTLRESMAPGATVSLRLDGFESVELTLPDDAAAEGDEPITLHGLLPWSDPVSITSTPSGARASIDGEVVGTTPFELRGRGSGSRVTLRLDRHDAATVLVEPGDAPHEMTLKPALPDDDAASSARALADAMTPFLSAGDAMLALRSETSGTLAFGEVLQLDARSATKTYAALFLVQSTGDALLLYPSERGGTLSLEAGRETRLPLGRHAARGYRVVASEPAGHDMAYLLLSSSPLPEHPAGQVLGGWTELFPLAADGRASALDLFRWAAEVRRAEPESTQLTRIDIQVTGDP